MVPVVSSNTRRLWRLDRSKFDYSTLPMVLGAVFRPAYEREVLSQAVARWTREVDFNRFAGRPISERDGSLDSIEGDAASYDVDVSIVEGIGDDLDLYVALSPCLTSYVTAWSKMLGVCPADLTGPSDHIWQRLFPDGELDRSRCLTWSLLGGAHRASPTAVAAGDPAAAEMAVPSMDVRFQDLAKVVGADGHRQQLLEIVNRWLTYEQLVGQVR